MPCYLVTAGSSREMIDRVRDWGNIFTGKTGLGIAQALAKSGGAVDLVTSNRDHLADLAKLTQGDAGVVNGVPYRSHSDLLDAIDRLMKQHRYDAIFMSAAVADYAPSGAFEVVSRETLPEGMERWTVRPAHGAKLPSTFAHLAFLGTPTEKIVDRFRSVWNHRGILVKFKLQVGLSKDELIAIGQASRKASGADYLVANTLEMVEGPEPGAWLLGDGFEEWVPRATLAARLVTLVKKK
ncbi:MAG: phosphopantothenoylcysteine decarboxylase [Tepidisphaeraceae bacterium]